MDETTQIHVFELLVFVSDVALLILVLLYHGFKCVSGVDVVDHVVVFHVNLVYFTNYPHVFWDHVEGEGGADDDVGPLSNLVNMDLLHIFSVADVT